MRFEEAFQGWTIGRLTQAEAAMLLGQCERSFRRHVERYKADGLEGLLDKRLIIKWTRARILVDQGRAAAAWQLVGKLEPHDFQSLEGGISSRRALHAELKCLMGQPRAGRDALERLADAIARDHYEHSPEPAWLRAKAGLCSVAAGDRARARALAGKARSAFDAQPQVSAYFKAPLVELERSLYRAPRSTPGGVPLVD